MSDSVVFSRREELKGPPSPTTKVSKWLTNDKRKSNELNKSEHVPIGATTHLNKLRDRLLLLRDHHAGDSFSSNGSERIAPSPTNTRDSPANNEGKSTRPSRGAWRISTQSSEQDAIIAITATAAPTNPQARMKSTLASGGLPPRSPPRHVSTSRLNPQPSPRTPPRPLGGNSAYSTPRQLSTSRAPTGGAAAAAATGSWEDQLGALDRLSKQLSMTATELSEDKTSPAKRNKSPEKLQRQHVKPQHRARRSSAADWEKYQDLAAQLAHARSQLENLSSSDDEDSFAAVAEDK